MKVLNQKQCKVIKNNLVQHALHLDDLTDLSIS